MPRSLARKPEHPQGAQRAGRPRAGPELLSIKPINPLQAYLRPSPELAVIVGSEPLLRPEAVSRLWRYIQEHNLQDSQNRREILADEKLRAVFGDQDKATMFELTKRIGQHLS